MERTQISLTQEQADRLRRLARRRRSSMAALIRAAVDRTYPEGSQRDAAWDKALAAAGGFRSDRTDVAERHDDYLADALGE
jgi:Arc/MetJ-type ribon-helix-helix transcriptional regulator